MCRAQCLLVVALLVGLAHSWDIAITVGDRLEFYTDNGTKTDTVRFLSQNLTALAYDDVHNMLLYVDKLSDNDAICGYNISYGEYKCYVERNGRNIQGLAFDPVTEILFFTDTKERSINWFSFKPGSKNNVYGNLLIKMDDGIPTDIAVDSCRGFIYWINTNLTTSTIERARFNGSDREVVINAKYNWDLHSLALDLQTQTIYWIMPETSLISHSCTADLNGNNEKQLIKWKGEQGVIMTNIHPNSYTVSKKNLYMVGFCSSCSYERVWKFQKESIKNYFNAIFDIHTLGVTGIAANYKMKDQFQGVSDCNHVLNNCETEDSFKIAREHEGPFCVHGTKVNGQSLCKCSPGYTGERCEVSLCENYCLHGNCSFTEQGLPVCRCSAGYSGERCELNVCYGYCSNSGTCSLNEDSQPFCQCQGGYVGQRCEISDCLNYCVNGNCSFDEQGLPVCRCSAGYSGERCELNVCYGYCSNNGTCSLNEDSQPFCQCQGGYVGQRCEISDCLNYCMNGNCSFDEQGLPVCRCIAGYSGERCELNVCFEYCSNSGTCSLNEDSQPYCQCQGGYVGHRCEISSCLNYCLNGNCSFDEQGLPVCRCGAGYSGERCELNVCHGYCSNSGTCSLNDDSQPFCQCQGGYVGQRCEISDCLNYCMNGNCSFDEQGLPVCRCSAGYSGERCELNVCYGYCSNSGTCSLNEDSQPFCQCQGGYVGQRCEISDCLNYCMNGNCSFDEQGLPVCRCIAGYSGERCEVNVCNGHCLNNGTCSLNEEDEPICECVGEYEGDRCEVSSQEEDEAAFNYLEEKGKNLTLADLLKNWRQRNNFRKSLTN